MSINRFARICAVGALAFIVFAALGPAKWQIRTGLGWQVDHFVGYFAITSMFCVAWPRPLVVAGAVAGCAALLEALQYFTPDRHSDLQAALYSASGVLTAALAIEPFIRAPRRLNRRTLPQLDPARQSSKVVGVR